MTRRLNLAFFLAVLGGLVLATGAPSQLGAPGLIAAAPVTTIDSGPDASGSPTGTFTFHSDQDADPSLSFQCSFDSAGFTGCSSPVDYNLPDGPHTFEVRATNGLEVGSAATASWTIDTTPPVTTITSAPIDTTASTSAAFSFTASESSTFQCRLVGPDGYPYTSCSSPTSYSDLANGQYVFTVKARDAAGNTSSDFESFTVDADVGAPVVTITSDPIGTTSSASATFTFTVDESSTIRCRLQGPEGHSFILCSSPRTYSDLQGGRYTFDVRATDAGGNTGTDSETWTVNSDSVAPVTTIRSGPVGTTSSTAATFTFTSSEPGSTFACRRNLGAFVPCASPTTYSALADGTHTFDVRATDPSGNTGAQASATWTVASSTTGVPPVGNLRAIAGDHRVRLVWTKPTGIGIRRIEVRRSGKRLPLYRGLGNDFIDSSVFNDRTYTYSVVLVDDLGARSLASSIFARPRGKFLRAPRDGATVQRAPMLRWLPRPRATYYNVLLFRNNKKVLSRWPARPRLQLRMQWRHNGRVYRLRNARYVWYVYPGIGARSAGRYGAIMGHSTFKKR
jgi:hypothetical protein